MKLKRHPNKAVLRKYFDYRDGHLYWKVNRGRSYIKGQKVGGLDGHGYLRAGVDYKDYQVHRLIWIWHYGASTKYIDHINGNKLDNRIENLRLVNKAKNEWHTPKRRNNTTGYKGVYKIKCATPSRYWAYITINGKRYGGGMFRTAREAALAYNLLAEKFHGEFAWLNKIN